MSSIRGVFLRWFVGQDGFEHAQELQQELVDGSVTVATIDFARVEVACGCRKPVPPGHMLCGTRPISVRRSVPDWPLLARPEVG